MQIDELRDRSFLKFGISKLKLVNKYSVRWIFPLYLELVLYDKLIILKDA